MRAAFRSSCLSPRSNRDLRADWMDRLINLAALDDPDPSSADDDSICRSFLCLDVIGR